MSEPRIKTTVVGSYPWPDWLKIDRSEQAVEDATRVILHTQEHAGIDVVCDGEVYRFDPNHPQTNGMIEYFVRPMSGIRNELTFDEITAFEAQQGMGFRTRPPGIVEGPVGSGTMNLKDPCALGKRLATRPFKFTLTGPHMLAKTLIDRHYGDIEALTDAVADVLAEQVARLDAEVVQLDEANLPGHTDEWEWAARAMNKVLDAVPGIPAVHLCFGNYGGQVVQTGGWDRLMAYLNALHTDHIICENAHRPAAEMAAFKELRPEIGMGLGVVDIKATETESPDAIARHIEEVEAIIGAGRVRYIHPDCGFWNLKRYIADPKIAVLAKGRDLFEGR